MHVVKNTKRTFSPNLQTVKVNDNGTIKTIKVCTAYEIGGKQVDYFPFESGEQVTPVYKEFPGWDCDICGVRDYGAFPKEFKDYVSFIEEQTGCPVKIISVGPDRSEIVLR